MITSISAVRRRLRLSSLIAMGTAAGTLWAAVPMALAGTGPHYMLHTGPAPAAVRALVGSAGGGQLKITGWFPGPHGVTGLEVRLADQAPSSKPQIVWALPASHVLVTGNLFDAHGYNMTQAAAAQLHAVASKPPPAASAKTATAAPASTPASTPAKNSPTAQSKPARFSPPPPVPGLTAAVKAADLQGFSQGRGPLQIIAVIDPNCIFCHRFWTDLNSIHDWQKMFTVEWVPVGALKPSSPGKAAAVLAGGVKALDQDERGFDDATETGGIAAGTDPKAVAAVAHNTRAWAALMKRYKRQTATPTLIIGGDYIVISALNADQLRTIYEAMTGKPVPSEINAEPMKPGASSGAANKTAPAPTMTDGEKTSGG